MSTSLYAEEEADFCFKGDEVTIKGTLSVEGETTFTGTSTNAAGKLIPFVVGSGSLTTGTAGAVWTSGVPALTAAQLYITITAGSTNYRIPLWADA